LLIDALSIADDSVTFSVLDDGEIVKMDEMLNQIKGLNITKNGLEYSIKLTPEEIINTKHNKPEFPFLPFRLNKTNNPLLKQQH
jgi:hypothetical protein